MVRLARRRYIAFKLKRAPPPPKKELLTALRKNITATLGSEGLEQHHIRIIEYDVDTGLGIVRCDHRAVATLLSTLKGLTEALGEHTVKTIGTSGSIKALRRKFLSEATQ